MTDDWFNASANSIGIISTGNTPSKKNGEFYNTQDYPFYKPTDLDKGLNINSSLDWLSNKGLNHSRIANENSVLVTCIGATIGKTGLIKRKGGFNQQINCIKLYTGIDPEFIYYQITSFKFQQQIKNAASSTTLPILNKSKFSNLILNIAPLPEQRAIVSKIEHLFSELDNGNENLKKAQEQLKIYRQAVLKKAFEINASNSDKWRVEKIKDVCDVKVGIVIKPTRFYSSNDGIRAFRSANVREFKIEDSNWVYFSQKGNDENKRTQITEGDVLIVRSGYPGTSCVVTKDFEGSNAIDILIASPIKNKILPEFLCSFNNSPFGKGLFSAGSRGVAQKHLNVGVYNNLEIPVPDLLTQAQVVDNIKYQLSICDKLEDTIKENLEKSEALRQSILKKAFKGELLTEQELESCRNEPDWEPAEKLLERINHEHKRSTKIKSHV